MFINILIVKMYVYIILNKNKNYFVELCIFNFFILLIDYCFEII